MCTSTRGPLPLLQFIWIALRQGALLSLADQAPPSWRSPARALRFKSHLKLRTCWLSEKEALPQLLLILFFLRANYSNLICIQLFLQYFLTSSRRSFWRAEYTM
jgi:hypothetical protein